MKKGRRRNEQETDVVCDAAMRGGAMKNNGASEASSMGQ
jgi:hypothetical protein